MITTFFRRAQIVVTIPLLLLIGFAFGAIGPQPEYHYPIPRQPVQMIGKVAVTTDAKFLTRAALTTICGKGQLPGCPVKHGGRS